MHPALLRLVLLGFVVRALVPIGFMPASLADGGPIRVCGSGLVGAWLEQIAAANEPDAVDASGGETAHAGAHAHSAEHPHTADPRHTADPPHTADPAHAAEYAHADDPAQPPHDSSHGSAHMVWEKCPAGTAFAHTALPSEFVFDLPQGARSFGTTEPVERPSVASQRSYEARAPPSA